MTNACFEYCDVAMAHPQPITDQWHSLCLFVTRRYIWLLTFDGGRPLQ
jgi:hypothetical protein